MIYALMDEYYLFSSISNKLMIMHDFINDSFSKLVVTLFTIFSLQYNFQIEDLIIKYSNSKIRWNKKWQFFGWDSGQMKKNLENLEHGFCLERTKLTLLKNVLPKFGLYWEKRRVIWAWFSQICCCVRPQNLSCKAKFALLLLKDGWKYIFLLINWLETIQFCNRNNIVIISDVTVLYSLYLNENRDQRKKLRMEDGWENAELGMMDSELWFEN